MGNPIAVLFRVCAASSLLVVAGTSDAQVIEPFRQMQEATRGADTDQEAIEISAMLRNLRSVTQSSVDNAPTQGPKPIESSQGKVVIYSAAFCGYCKQAVKHAVAKKVPFVEKDIEKDNQAAREYKSLGGRGVPLILFGEKKLSGWSASAFDKEYADFEKANLSNKASVPAAKTAVAVNSSSQAGADISGSLFSRGNKFASKISGAMIIATPIRGSRPIVTLDKGNQVISTGDEQGEFLRVTSARGNGWVDKSLIEIASPQGR